MKDLFEQGLDSFDVKAEFEEQGNEDSSKMTCLTIYIVLKNVDTCIFYAKYYSQ